MFDKRVEILDTQTVNKVHQNRWDEKENLPVFQVRIRLHCELCISSTPEIADKEQP